MTKLIIENGEAFLSYSYIQSFGVGYNTIKHWSERKIAYVKYFEGKAYVKYKDIPAPTRRKKIPLESILLKEHYQTQTLTKVKELLHKAFYFDYIAYKHLYENEASFTTTKITEFAKLHSVFQAILDLKKDEGFRQTQILHKEFNDLFNNKYKTKIAFCNAILKAKVDGIMSVAMDKRTFGNNDNSKKEITPAIDYVMQGLVSSNGKFSNVVMLEKANAHFAEHGMKQYGLSWMKKQRVKWLKNIVVYASRYGQNEAQKIMPFASLKNANLTHIQWQVDGFNLPFWEWKIVDGKKKGFFRSVLVFVIDNCSKKIIGYSIGNTENSDVIKDAIRKAMFNTGGVLPFELVMDNHSFTQTKSAFNFENLLTKLGAKLTKTSNPRQKVIVERYIQNLDSLFKYYSGYLGKSIRSKSIEDSVSDELKTDYAKKFKSKAEVIGIVTEVIENYNNKPQKGITPNQAFINNPHPTPLVLNQFNRAELLPITQEKQIRNGQITIMRGVEKFEFQLPDHLFQKWNNEIVLITYDELQNGIWLFNKLNNEGIIFLQQKYKINNAKALQNEDDIKALYRNKGRIAGIKSKARLQLTTTRDKALNIDPEAYEKLNALTAPKDLIKSLEQDAYLQGLVEDNGVSINELETNTHSFDLPLALKPQSKNTNPFNAKGNKIELIDPNKLEYD